MLTQTCLWPWSRHGSSLVNLGYPGFQLLSHHQPALFPGSVLVCCYIPCQTLTGDWSLTRQNLCLKSIHSPACLDFGHWQGPLSIALSASSFIWGIATLSNRSYPWGPPAEGLSSVLTLPITSYILTSFYFLTKTILSSWMLTSSYCSFICRLCPHTLKTQQKLDVWVFGENEEGIRRE